MKKTIFGLAVSAILFVSSGCDLIVAIAEGTSGFNLSACRGNGFSVCAQLVWDNMDKLEW